MRVSGTSPNTDYFSTSRTLASDVPWLCSLTEAHTVISTLTLKVWGLRMHTDVHPSFPGPPAYRWQMGGMPSLHNHVRHSSYSACPSSTSLTDAQSDGVRNRERCWTTFQLLSGHVPDEASLRTHKWRPKSFPVHLCRP